MLYYIQEVRQKALQKERGYKMKIGDYIETPRFLNVKITAIYNENDNEKAYNDGYSEPTHYRKNDYYIRGKHTGLNTMVFAAIKRP